MPPVGRARERILEAARELVAQRGFGHLLMEEVAEHAGVSRATLYRLFPGRSALFRELVRLTPLETLHETIANRSHETPEVVMPDLAAAVYRRLAAGPRFTVEMLGAAAAGDPDTAEAVEYVFGQILSPALAYIFEAMQSGRLRREHPLLALQAFAGPIFFHAITRHTVESRLPLDLDGEGAARRFAEIWLRAMAPEGDDS